MLGRKMNVLEMFTSTEQSMYGTKSILLFSQKLHFTAITGFTVSPVRLNHINIFALGSTFEISFDKSIVVSYILQSTNAKENLSVCDYIYPMTSAIHVYIYQFFHLSPIWIVVSCLEPNRHFCLQISLLQAHSFEALGRKGQQLFVSVYSFSRDGMCIGRLV